MKRSVSQSDGGNVVWMCSQMLRGILTPDNISEVAYALAYCALLDKKMGAADLHIAPDTSYERIAEHIYSWVEDGDVLEFVHEALRRVRKGDELSRVYTEILRSTSDEELETFLANMDFAGAAEPYADHSTPEGICSLALRLLSPLSGSKLADLGSGVGSFLSLARREALGCEVLGIEGNRTAAAISKIRLSIPKLAELSRLPENAVETRKTILADSLACGVSVGDMFSLAERGGYDRVFSNYPWGMRTADLSRSSEFAEQALSGKLGYRRPTTADWVFNHLVVDTLSDKGRAVVLMTSGACYNTTDEGARRFFVEHGLVEAVVMLPPRLFPATAQSHMLVVLSRGNKNVRMVDARDLVEVGRRQNGLSADAADEIERRLSSEVEGLSREVSPKEIASAGYVLSPPTHLAKPLEIRHARRLGDVVERISRGATLRAAELDELTVNEATGYRYLMLGDIQDGTVSDELPSLSGIDERLERHCVEEGDVLLSKNGSPFKVAVAELPEDAKVLANGNLYVIKVDRKVLDPYYLAAFLGSNKGMEALSSAVVGVTIPNIPLRMLREVPVPVPPLDEQRETVLEYQAKLDEVRILKMRVRDAIDDARSLFDGEGR